MMLVLLVASLTSVVVTVDCRNLLGPEPPDSQHLIIDEKNKGFDLRPFDLSAPQSVAAADELYQGDILMSEEQWDDLRTRKALDGQQYLWHDGPDGYPLVPYVFNDSLVNQRAVRAGLDHWMEHTCIKFEPTSDRNQIHIQFIKGGGCYLSLANKNKVVSIGSRCGGLNIVVHEIGHAMGFFHEQARTDRDDYITILVDKFEGIRDDNNFSVPYDYTSVMQYSAPFGGYKNSMPAFMTKNPLDFELLRGIHIPKGLSYRDKLLANRLYNCTGKWLAKCNKTSDPCLNDGYTGKHCSCICPPNTSGSKCEKIITDDYYAQFRSPLNEKITTEKKVTAAANGVDWFYKWIVPPPCKRAKLTFTSTKDWNNNCRYHKLYVNTNPSDVLGQFLCGPDVRTGLTFSSDTGIIITTMNNLSGPRIAWEADVEFENIAGCYPACTDKNKWCTAWSNSGECEKNPDWMLPNCPKACNHCGRRD